MKITLPSEDEDRDVLHIEPVSHHAGKKTFNGLTVLKEIKEIISDEDSHLDSAQSQQR